MKNDHCLTGSHEPQIILFFMHMEALHGALVGDGHCRLAEFCEDCFVSPQDLHKNPKLNARLICVWNIIVDFEVFYLYAFDHSVISISCSLFCLSSFNFTSSPGFLANRRFWKLFSVFMSRPSIS